MFDQSSFSFLKIKQLLSSCTRTDLFLLAVGLVGFAAIAYGFSLLILSRNTSLLVSASDGQVVLSNNTTPPLVVEVSGAVNKPGIYSLEHGARVGQALELAGNFTENADTQYVAKQLNLAQTVNDGDKIFIPFFEEKELISSINAEKEGSASGLTTATEPGKISINQATESQLIELSGIGEKRAEAIISGRPYQSLSQLLEKEVLTEKLFNELEMELSL